MNVPREQISTTLFTLLTGNSSLTTLCPTISRSPKIWTEVSAADQPALFLFKDGPDTERPTQNARGLTRWQIEYNLFAYIRCDAASETIPETIANHIADAIDAALQGTPKGQAQTLGGIVTQLNLEGPTAWNGGILDRQMVLAWKVRVITGI